jgi:poly(hydroxyalkanoate) granule-associated protein
MTKAEESKTTEGTTEESTEQTTESSVGHKAWLVGLGVIEVAIESGGHLFGYLAEKGESFEARHKEDFDGTRDRAREAGREAKEKVQTTWKRVSSTVDEKVSSAFSRAGVSGDEIEDLKARVEDLTSKVEGLSPETAKV